MPPPLRPRPTRGKSRKRCERSAEDDGYVASHGNQGTGDGVLRDGVRVGYLRSASYGHTLGGAVGLAMIDAGRPMDAAWIDAGRWEVEVNGRMVPALASLQPLYDPQSQRVRGCWNRGVLDSVAQTLSAQSRFCAPFGTAPKRRCRVRRPR